jgi:Dolichyl-phosphate-mannose-protein mannosyltransferase
MNLSQLKFSFTPLFLVVLIFKAALAWYLLYLTKCGNPEIALSDFALASGDTFSYIGAMENYISNGTYSFFNGREDVLAGRLPHYSIPYFLFRQLFSQTTSYSLLVILQFVVECTATTIFILFCHRLIPKTPVTILLACMCLLATNWTQLSLFASPESLSCSLLVFFIWAYHRYLERKRISDLILTGVFLGLLVSLKIYFVLLFLPVGIHFLIDQRPLGIIALKNVVALSLIVSCPMMLSLVPWTVRNYFVLNKFIPFQINATAGYNYSSAELSFRKFVTAWGGNFIFWEKSAAGCYFMPQPDVPCEFVMPSYAFTSEGDRQEVEAVRANFIELQKKYSDSLDQQVTLGFQRLTLGLKKEKPLEYFFLAPLRITGKFLFHSGSYYLPIHKTNPCYWPPQLVIKILQSGIYWLALLVGLPALFHMAFKSRYFVLPFLPCLIIILFPIVFRTGESRYFRTVEPMLYLGIAYATQKMFERLNQR